MGGFKRSQLILVCGFVVATSGNGGSVAAKINHKEGATNALHVRCINLRLMLLYKGRNTGPWPECHNMNNFIEA